jgi:hypothetical protein
VNALPAQVDLFLDPFPRLTGAVLVFFGLELVLAGAFQRVLSEAGLLGSLTPRERFVGVGGLAVGLLFAASGALRTLDLLGGYVVVLFCLGRVIQGAATVRFYRRVVDFLRGRGTGGGLRGRIRHGLVILFVAFLAVWLAFRVLTRGPIVGNTVQSLRLVWTGFVVLTGALGIARKLRHADDELNRGLKAGLVLAVTGAEVYAFQTVAMDLLAYLAGSAAFSVGFWVAVSYLFGSGSGGGSAAAGTGGPPSPGASAGGGGHSCSDCGAPADPGDNYCSDCGARL